MSDESSSHRGWHDRNQQQNRNGNGKKAARAGKGREYVVKEAKNIGANGIPAPPPPPQPVQRASSVRLGRGGKARRPGGAGSIGAAKLIDSVNDFKNQTYAQKDVIADLKAELQQAKEDKKTSVIEARETKMHEDALDFLTDRETLSVPEENPTIVAEHEGYHLVFECGKWAFDSVFAHRTVFIMVLLSSLCFERAPLIRWITGLLTWFAMCLIMNIGALPPRRTLMNYWIFVNTSVLELRERRPDNVSMAEIKHKAVLAECNYVMCRYVWFWQNPISICEYYVRCVTLTNWYIVRKVDFYIDYTVDLELLSQIATPNNLRLSLDEKIVWEKIQYSAQSCQTVDLDRVDITHGLPVVQWTCLLALDLWRKTKFQSKYANFPRPQ